MGDAFQKITSDRDKNIMVEISSEGELPVDVIIPYSESYTPEDLLLRAIESVKEQCINTNILIQTESGVALARNQGLIKSENRFVAFLDADDYWERGKLVSQLRSLQKSKNGICISNSFLLNQNETTDLDSDPESAINSIFLGKVYGLTSTILIDSQKVQTSFDISIDRREDHLFILEAASESGLTVITDPVVRVDRHGSGLSSGDDPKMKLNSHREFYKKSTAVMPRLERLESKFWHEAYKNLGYLSARQKNHLLSIYFYSISARYYPIGFLSHVFDSVIW